MNYNPYASPNLHGQGPPPTGAPVVEGPAQPWEIGELLSRSWEIFKTHWAVLVVSGFIVTIIGVVPNVVVTVVSTAMRQGPPVVPFSNEYWIQSGISGALSWVTHMLLLPGIVRLNLAAARGQAIDVGMLFSGFNRIPAVLATMLLQMLVIVLGLLFFIVPGIYFGVASGMASSYCIDAGLSPVASIKASLNATQGQRGKIFLTSLVFTLITLGGMAACCVGTLAATPFIYLTSMLLFVRVSGRDIAREAAPPPAYGAYGAGPGPGYGTGYNG